MADDQNQSFGSTGGQIPQGVNPVPPQQNPFGASPLPQGAKPQQQASGNTTGYVFGQIADKVMVENPPKIPVPEHSNTNFDEKRFIRDLMGSISLLWQEKAKIIESIPKLSQYQIDELCRILEEETTKFQELSKEHGDQLMQLEQKHIDEFRQIESLFAEEDEEDKSAQQAEEIKKNLGLS
ncbi:MAG: hypothetical protein UR28_C0020G0018 [Candidatus Peregrinibacteria bacterium GW2011_GWF2_33_10]|nr:MAG: hypothetical protein UR28_C0020G0018 [Candidatus Peregrinibacteria bacterium GW2011_GWF2_33_10]OGJ45321.1 MAG: hypothetical protein A2272_06215 [Candidatus Peregrinibacteria bacterium RIFOXYA12_FULL_33_12]OGJ45387.1 MAG: hypothetical protein A2263_03925 [Candidatus Peregrinibacteria bacterium RIFOXYA2_FULL_33_21]OGJ50990.1 MAG: hypothetical protein A2307_05520 [Candidatus Peregrinibacteria bacterium RIFOXYB2_FULL_33_20]